MMHVSAFFVLGRINSDNSCPICSKAMILVHSLDTIVTNKIKVNLDIYH